MFAEMLGDRFLVRRNLQKIPSSHLALFSHHSFQRSMFRFLILKQA